MHSVYFLGSIRGGRFDGRLGGRLDDGDVFYAPALARDESGRGLMWGWAQERLAREHQSGLSHAGALTLPRLMTLEGERLHTRPVPELEALRAERVAGHRLGGEPQLELIATVEGAAGTGGWVLAADDVHVEALIDPMARRLRVTVAGRAFEAALEPCDRYTLRLFVDGSLIEAFAGDAAITTRAYLEAGGWRRADVRSDGTVRVTDTAVWRIRDDVVES
jgi:beta-fructofuranosidase